MARKSVPFSASITTAPDDLDAMQASVWRREFGQVPAGHFLRSDIPAMRTHVALCIEADAAFRGMIERGRSRDSATHWRSTQAMLLASRRALRLLPHSRISPQRAGVIGVGSANADATSFDPTSNWRDIMRSCRA